MNGRRVENLGANVSAWCERTHEGSSTWDLCEEHATDLDLDPHFYDAYLVPSGSGEPAGEDGRRGDVVHPCYDSDIYYCELPWCTALLTGW